MTVCPKPTKRKRKQSERQILKAKLDKIVPEIVKQRDGWQCVQCSTRERPTDGHVIPRGTYGTRWDLLNNHCQCASCNYKHRTKPHLYITWFISNFGLSAWKELNRRAERLEKSYTVPEMRELLAQLEDVYERMQTLAVYDKDMLIAIGAYGKYGIAP